MSEQVKIDLATRIVEVFGPDAALQLNNRANLTSAIMTVVRPYVAFAVTGRKPAAVRREADSREKLWRVKTSLYAGTELLANGIFFQVRGLHDVAQGLSNWLASTQSGDWTGGTLPSALAYLRPTISRQGGRATLRRSSPDGEWTLIADIEDAGLPER